MNKKILVTYASRTGTTAGVADAIGKTLSENGTDVDVLPMKDVKNLEQYDTVIAGSAIRAAKWLPEAMEFLESNRESISKKPFAAFQVCMTMAMPNAEKYRQGVSEWMSPVRKIARPVKEGIFAGKLDISQLESLGGKIKFRISVWTGVWKEGDHRNWNEIRSWAEELKSYLAGKR
jgi:menaquinone-dependent protoporphyrinogen oxidase